MVFTDWAHPGHNCFDQESPRGGDERTDLSKTEEAMKILRRRGEKTSHGLGQRVWISDCLGKRSVSAGNVSGAVLGLVNRATPGCLKARCKDSPNKDWETYLGLPVGPFFAFYQKKNRFLGETAIFHVLLFHAF